MENVSETDYPYVAQANLELTILPGVWRDEIAGMIRIPGLSEKKIFFSPWNTNSPNNFFLPLSFSIALIIYKSLQDSFRHLYLLAFILQTLIACS